jgi:hypothetical protein
MPDMKPGGEAAPKPQPNLDAFEWRARFVPALLAWLPLLPLSGALGGPLLTWLGALVAGTGVAAVAAVGLSYLASTMGNLYQSRLWPDWPHDSPANRGLRPGDKSRSEAQRQQLHAAIRDLTGMDLATVAASGDGAEVDRLIDDAMSRLRARLSGDTSPLGSRVKLHLIDYNFARNFAGLWPFWMSASAVSLVWCWILYVRAAARLEWALAATGVSIAAVALASWLLAPYVRHRAGPNANEVN